MTRLSSPFTEIKAHYDVVVIGSGYGGGISASRLSRAGKKVCVLERGKEFQTGDFPTNKKSFLRELQVDRSDEHGADRHIGSRTGLYDVRVNKEMAVFVGCGLGGTSLVNANVSLRPEAGVFADPRFPQGLRDAMADLDKAFDRAKDMLRPTPYPESAPKLPKMAALEQSAAALGKPVVRVPINVTFEDGVNAAGVQQRACTLCGDCVSGCNHDAKTTVAMTYLPDARRHGAALFTEVAVTRVARGEGKWLVYYDLPGAGRDRFAHAGPVPALFVTADIVVLAGGTLGSTEILLRSQAAGLGLSAQVGEHFSGNGDVIALGYNNEEVVNGIGLGDQPQDRLPKVGPTITSMIDGRDAEVKSDGVIIEEGAIPGALAWLLPDACATTARLLGKDGPEGLADKDCAREREARSLTAGAYRGAIQNTQTYLLMCQDDEGGRLELAGDRLRVVWQGAASEPAFARAETALRDANRPLGGTYLKDPLSTQHKGLITVHPLGGCVMAERAEDGVVNHKGQVFAGPSGTVVHEGLFVCDGSIVPRPLGVNPLLTISALTEYCCAALARDRGWSIDYGQRPELPAPLTIRGSGRLTGIQFTETMSGRISALAGVDHAEGQGPRGDTELLFTVTMQADNLGQMLCSPEHELGLLGTVVAPALSASPLVATEGTCNLLVRAPRDADGGMVREMRYRMKLTSVEGKAYFLIGTKMLHDDPGFDVWQDATTLFITLFAGDTPQGTPLAKGILRIDRADLLRQVSTVKVLHGKTIRDEAQAVIDFTRFFFGGLVQIYGKIFDRDKDAAQAPGSPPAQGAERRVSAGAAAAGAAGPISRPGGGQVPGSPPAA